MNIFTCTYTKGEDTLNGSNGCAPHPSIATLEPLVSELLDNAEPGRIPGRIDSLYQDLH
jgi:hypothetical protein